jgi:hypothetical protein
MDAQAIGDVGNLRNLVETRQIKVRLTTDI